MTIQVDKSKCIGLGYCWDNCSSVFGEGTDGKAYVQAGKENAQDPCVLDSQANCCPGAIVIS